jgi:peptidoglycan/xylan/chitin deacetylase (PgdA/CDA1 family)
MNDVSSYTVLLFHSIDDRARLSLKNLGNVRPETFERVCTALKREFDVVGIRELVGLISGSAGKRGRFLTVTFDDGAKSYALNAAPILESLKIPSICFLITGCVGDKAVYWRYLYNYCINSGFGGELAALVNAEYGVSIKEEDIVSFSRSNYTREKTRLIMEGISRHIIAEEEYLKKENELFLSYEDIRRLKDSPLVEFGIHTHTHPVMKGLGDEEILDEISVSAAFYRDRIGDGRPMFSVPFGRLYKDYDERTIKAALDLPTGAIFSAYGGRNGSGQSLYNIRRIPFHEDLLESGVEKFVHSLFDSEAKPEYREAEKRLSAAMEQRA